MALSRRTSAQNGSERYAYFGFIVKRIVANMCRCSLSDCEVAQRQPRARWRLAMSAMPLRSSEPNQKLEVAHDLEVGFPKPQS